jgi:hypothetical protein
MFLLRCPSETASSGDGTKVSELMSLHGLFVPSGSFSSTQTRISVRGKLYA